jgi:sRNA-binding regulator protein Hfq
MSGPLNAAGGAEWQLSRVHKRSGQKTLVMAQATKLFDLSNHAATAAPRPSAKPVAVLVECETVPQVLEGPRKLMQTQTPMVFVLEDGESIQGVVEWFDRDTIKVRNATRILVFKRSVKYLYKAGEGKA